MSDVMPGFILDVQRRAAAAAKTAEIKQAPSTRAMAMLVRRGWDYETRMGQRIWCYEEVNGGAFYGEEMALKISDERKGI